MIAQNAHAEDHNATLTPRVLGIQSLSRLGLKTLLSKAALNPLMTTLSIQVVIFILRIG